MNYLTAMLLMVLAKDEVKTFWVLVALLGDDGEILIHTYLPTNPVDPSLSFDLVPHCSPPDRTHHRSLTLTTPALPLIIPANEMLIAVWAASPCGGASARFKAVHRRVLPEKEPAETICSAAVLW